MYRRDPYAGLHRKLVVGIDIGTTYSGVSYAILDPGNVPVIHGVNRCAGSPSVYTGLPTLISFSYPAQESVGGDAKIPSVLYYDQNGLVRAVGAEALLQSNIELAGEQQWVRADWCCIHPPSDSENTSDPS
jgi:molecular chaperone DnaK (HSP70)